MAKKAVKKAVKRPVIAAEETKKINEDGSNPPTVITKGSLLEAFISGYGKSGDDDSKNAFSTLLSKYLNQESEKHGCSNNYNTIILYDDSTIVNSDSDRIYNAVKGFKDTSKPILLILYSRGGEPGPAYLIGKLCREFSNGTLVVAIPRRAKSAATLISCAANQIHMGSLSQLGPIDPQIDGMPALGLKNSIEHIAELASKYKNAEGMFARYMHLSIKPVQIGYYERVAESAQQYAVRLLQEHASTLKNKPADIANELVHVYKDHSFVIDKSEAKRIFGDKTVICDSVEYEYSNMIYEILSDVEQWADIFNQRMYFIGSLNSGVTITKQ